MNPPGANNPDRDLLLPVWSVADGIGVQAPILAPWIIGIYITDLGFRPIDAGLLLSIEFISLALVNFACAPWMARLPRRTLALAGALAVVAANGYSATLDAWQPLVLARIMAGIGAGLAMSAGNATAAGARDPARLYGQKTALLALYASAMFIVIPPLVEKLGPHYLFILMATFNLLLIIPARHLPQRPVGGLHDAAVGRGTGQQGLVLSGILIAAAVLCFFNRDIMVYVFVEQIGTGLEISRARIGQINAVSSVFAILGPITAIWFAHRFRELVPIVVVVILGALLTHTLVQTQSQAVFALMVFFQGFLNLAGYALHMSWASRLDPLGRLTAACGGSVLTAYALSPLAATWFSEMGGTAGLQVGLAGFGLANLVLVVAVRWLSGDRHRA